MNTSRTGARSVARQAGCQPAYYEHARSYNRDTGLFQPYRHAVVEALPLQPGQVSLDIVGYGLTHIPGGMLATAIGMKKTLVLGLLVQGLAGIMSGLSYN